MSEMSEAPCPSRGVPEILSGARTIYGERRFYPPGQHPVMHRTRAVLDKLNALRERVPDTVELLAAIAYHEHQLTQFEAGEHEAKLRYLDAHWPRG